ncbi:hypothetical protein M434DRAFT_402576 [Hypoxylon sp. CO27-5]|nr:hypothetical protein M434DRAFT_402576 [Hypoxylon sp. CO27-5]
MPNLYYDIGQNGPKHRHNDGDGGEPERGPWSSFSGIGGTNPTSIHNTAKPPDSSSDPDSDPPTKTSNGEEPSTANSDDGGGGSLIKATTISPITISNTISTSGSSSAENASEVEDDTTNVPSMPTPPLTTAPTITEMNSPSITSSESTSIRSSIPTSPSASTSTSTTPQPTSSDQASITGASNSDSGSGNGTGSGIGTGNQSESKDLNTSTNAQTVPTWAIPLMVIFIAMGLAFLASLVFFCIKERRKKNEEQGGTKPSYPRAVGKALTTATLLFIPIWIVKRLREWNKKREEEREERDRNHQEQMAAYAKLRDEQEQENEQDEEQERGLGGEQDDRRLEEGVVIVERSVSPVSAPTLAPPTSPVGRSPSMVSSLSSRSQGSQGQYERLENIVPSPVTEETPYVWRPPRPSETQTGNPEGRGVVTQTDTASRRESDIPSVLRPGGGG